MDEIGSHHLRSVGIGVLLAVSCACVSTTTLPPPRSLHRVTPRRDNGGHYLCPYTQDHVLAEWVDMQIKGGAFGKIGGGLGSGTAVAVGGSAMGIWGVVLSKVGRSIGRAAAIRSAGGMENIRATSDMSFDRLDDLAVYIYQFYSAEDTYSDALAAAVLLYPKLEDRYIPAIQEAQK